MKVEFKVHGVAKGVSNAQTVVDGETLTAQVPCLEVELVTTAERHGNVTLRFIGSSIPQAKALFEPDAVVVATFAAGK